jgi:hypothetical protein
MDPFIPMYVYDAMKGKKRFKSVACSIPRT